MTDLARRGFLDCANATDCVVRRDRNFSRLKFERFLGNRSQWVVAQLPSWGRFAPAAGHDVRLIALASRVLREFMNINATDADAVVAAIRQSIRQAEEPGSLCV